MDGVRTATLRGRTAPSVQQKRSLWSNPDRLQRRSLQTICMKGKCFDDAVAALRRKFLPIEEHVQGADAAGFHDHFVLRWNEFLLGSNEGDLVGRLSVDHNGNPAFLNLVIAFKQDCESAGGDSVQSGLRHW